MADDQVLLNEQCGPGDVLARITYPGKKRAKRYSADILDWDFPMNHVEFSRIDKAEFTGEMVLATMEFDKDHSFYVLLPEDVFLVKADAL